MVFVALKNTLKVTAIFALLHAGGLSSDAPSQAILTAYSDSITKARQFADKFTVTPAQQTAFLTLVQNLVGTFNLANSSQRAAIIESIEDARFGGTMTPIQSQLDAILATAKATPAGIQSATDSKTPPSPADQKNVEVVVPTYLDRIASLATLLETFRYKKPVEADRTQIFSLINGLFADRGESFADERQRFSQVLLNAKVLIYRDDATIKPQIDVFITQLSTVVPFDIQLATQKKLYSIFQPLTDKQKARVLKHFQEMTAMLTGLTDITLNNDFRDLLQFSDVAFFQDDPAAHAAMLSMLSKVTVLDPIFMKPYGEIISSLKTLAPTLFEADLSEFMKKVETLVSMRYGNKASDEINKSANFTALQDLLNYLISLPPFASNVNQLTLWLASVKMDTVAAATTSFYNRILTYSTTEFMSQTQNEAKRAQFMIDLENLVNDRYGDSLPATVVPAGSVPGITRDTTYKGLLKRLLDWILLIPWHSSNFVKVQSYINLINQDPATGPFALTLTTTTTTSSVVQSTNPVGTFSVLFGSDINAQLTQLEQSLGAISSDNHRELFILSFYDVVVRKSAATTVDVGRMRILASSAKINLLLGATYSSFCSFILAGIDADFNTATRNQLHLDFLARAAGMTNPVPIIQEWFLRFASSLISDSGSLTTVQRNSLGNSLQQVSFRTFFLPEHIDDAKELYKNLVDKLAAAGTALTQNGQTTTSATNSTGAVVLESAASIIPTSDAVLPTTAATTTPNTTTNSQITAQQQQNAAIALINARTNGWR